MKHVWTLSWFDPATERLVGEATFESLSDDVVAEILAVPPEDVLDGEFPLDMDRARRLQITTGHAPALGQYEYFLGATTV